MVYDGQCVFRTGNMEIIALKIVRAVYARFLSRKWRGGGARAFGLDKAPRGYVMAPPGGHDSVPQQRVILLLCLEQSRASLVEANLSYICADKSPQRERERGREIVSPERKSTLCVIPKFLGKGWMSYYMFSE